MKALLASLTLMVMAGCTARPDNKTIHDLDAAISNCENAQLLAKVEIDALNDIYHVTCKPREFPQ
jgi:hypothetical protein